MMIFKKFLKEKRGIVTVEFAFVSLAMMAIILFSMDTGMYIMEKNKIERINYSLITVIRERTRLYEEEIEVTQEETNDLALAATKLLNLSFGEDIKVKLDALYFDAASTDTNPIIEKALSFISQKPSDLDDQKCFSHLPAVDTLKKHSVWVRAKGGWLPVFRVSICAPNRNKTPMPYFERSNHDPSIFSTYSVAVIR